VIPWGRLQNYLIKPFWFFCFYQTPPGSTLPSGFSKTKNPAFAGFDQIVLAEKEGFEPPDPWLQINGFQDRRIRPLCHFSFSPFLRRKVNIFLFFENLIELFA
jgi:hypothetical protein